MKSHSQKQHISGYIYIYKINFKIIDSVKNMHQIMTEFLRLNLKMESEVHNTVT